MKMKILLRVFGFAVFVKGSSINLRIDFSISSFKTLFFSLKAEFAVFESTNKRIKNLGTLFEALKTVRLSSIVSEPVFSVSGNFVSQIRTRLSHDSVNVLCF